MVKNGVLFTCDRCGKEQFIEKSAWCPPGWISPNSNCDLCQDCADLYNKMMNNFFAPEVKRPISIED